MFVLAGLEFLEEEEVVELDAEGCAVLIVLVLRASSFSSCERPLAALSSWASSALGCWDVDLEVVLLSARIAGFSLRPPPATGVAGFVVMVVVVFLRLAACSESWRVLLFAARGAGGGGGAWWRSSYGDFKVGVNGVFLIPNRSWRDREAFCEEGIIR